MKDETKTYGKTAADASNTSRSNDRATASKSSNRRSKGKKKGKDRQDRNSGGRFDTKSDQSGEPFKDRKGSSKTRGLTNFDMENVDGTNDISWYAKNPQILIDSASFSYNAAVGSPMKWEHGVDQNFIPIDQVGDYADTVPGIMKIKYANYPGTSKDNNSAINIAADNVYSYVRHANSGHANYDSPDLMMYIMAIDSLYSFLAYGRRAYGTARLFNQKNYYYQKALIEAQGFDYNDLIVNLSNFRLYLNTFAAKASAFAVPSAMPILQRHFFMCSNIYKDRDTEKSQLYVFVPAGFHKYGVFEDLPTPYNEVGTLRFSLLPGQGDTGQQGKLTFSQFVAYGNDMLDRLLNSEDIGIISGDILKAFQGKLWTLPVTPEEFVLMPVYNKEILSQIENSRELPTPVKAKIFQTQGANLDALDVVQDPVTGTIIADFEAANPDVLTTSSTLYSLMSSFNPVLSLDFDHPLPGDAMIATRLMQAWRFIPSTDVSSNGLVGRWDPSIIPSEIIVGYSIFQYIGNSLVENSFNQNTGNQSSWASNIVSDLFNVSNFAHHPFCYWGKIEATVEDGKYTKITLHPFGAFGDIDTYRMMHVDEVNNVNTAALLSMFDVPVLGTY